MHSPEDLSKALAFNLLTLRKEHRYTLDRLATLANVSKGMLVQIEQGKTNPSIATLARIANALNVSVPRLIEVEEKPDVTISAIADTAPLLKKDTGSTAVPLLGHEGETVVELWDWRIAPSDSFEGGPHIDGAIEMLMIHSGVLTLHLNDQSFDVPAGSAVRFKADLPHTYANHGDEELRLTMVTVEPAQ